MEKNMNEDQMIQDMVAQLDKGFADGVGHVNLNVNSGNEPKKNVETMGCTDCSRTPLACSVPTLHQGLDDYQ